jgi:hypothetical protein
MILHF